MGSSEVTLYVQKKAQICTNWLQDGKVPLFVLLLVFLVVFVFPSDGIYTYSFHTVTVQIPKFQQPTTIKHKIVCIFRCISLVARYI